MAQSQPSPAARQVFERFVERYRDDPVGFVQNVLGADPTPWQRQFLGAVASGQRRISIRAGHGVGKSTACSWCAIHHMICKFPQKTVMTAPSAPQLYDALLAECKSWFNKLPSYIRELFIVLSERIVLAAAPEESFISARTSVAERPEALSGVHSANVLLLVDEAPGVPEPIYEAASGSMSGHHATTVLIGNPTRLSGLFFRSHKDPRLASKWVRMHVSCIDNPLVSKDYIEEQRITYGEGSDPWRVRVLGDFPSQETDVLIPFDLVDAAMRRDIPVNPNAPVVFGLDVGRSRDRSALVKRQNQVVTQICSWNSVDTVRLIGHVLDEVAKSRPIEICVDAVGLGGPIADQLRALSAQNFKYDVIDVNVSENSALNTRAYRLRDDLWMAARDWFETRTCSLPRNDSLLEELTTPKYGFTASGLLVVDSKEEIKKLLQPRRSPDLADALCLTFASIQGRIIGGHSSWRRGEALKRGIRGVV